MATIANPSYTTSNGVDLALNPIGALVLQRWGIEYNKRHPAPVPPFREVNIAGTPVKQHDPADPYYVQQLEAWESARQDAQSTFIFSRGVKTAVPSDYQGDPDVLPENHTQYDLKAAWVSEQLITIADMQGLQQAILSLTTVTTEALDDAQKK